VRSCSIIDNLKIYQIDSGRIDFQIGLAFFLLQRILDRIARVSEDFTIARKVFTWLLCGRDQFSLDVLALASVTEPFVVFDPEMALDRPETILDICRSLIDIMSKLLWSTLFMPLLGSS
jgi:hypothetical protein